MAPSSFCRSAALIGRRCARSARGFASSVRERAERDLQARAAIDRVVDPALAVVRSVATAEDGNIRVELGLRCGVTPGRDAIVSGACAALRELPWVREATCTTSLLPPRRLAEAGPTSLAAVSHVIGVSSCKGGVGKSTVAVNLAFALAQLGGRVGLLDADLYGPSLPTLVRLPEGALPVVRAADKLLRPPEVCGVRLMSFGYVAKGASAGTAGAALVRGPIASSTVQQLASGTGWGPLDFLVVDLPPGTGDILLTLCQSVGLTGAVVVSTPGRLSTADSLKGIDMLAQTRVPVLALVENMSAFTDPAGLEHRLFGPSQLHLLASRVRTAEAASALPAPAPADAGEDEAQAAASATEAQGCFRLPIEAPVCEAVEAGLPLVLSAPESASARSFFRLAAHVAARAAEQRRSAETQPSVSFRAADRAVVLRFLSGALEGREYAVPAAVLRANSLDAKSAQQRAAAAAGAAGASAADFAAVHPASISPRGNYGVAIAWSDGHTSAIYSFEQIIALASEQNPQLGAAAGVR